MGDSPANFTCQKCMVGIFWDIENCAVPKGKSAAGVVNNIRNYFIVNRPNHREHEFLVACDTAKLRKDIADDLNKAGTLTLAHVSGTMKNAADEKLRDSMRRFVDTHANMSNSTDAGSPFLILILISGDIDFVNDLRGYQIRQGCKIILIHNSNCSPQFKLGWNETYSFQEFCAEMDDQGPLRAMSATAVAEYLEAQQTSAWARPGDRESEQNRGRLEASPRANQRSRSRNREQQPQHSNSNPDSNEEYILMVSGLPGKSDFRRLKADLQARVNKVNGRVKFVRNGQGFITFRNRKNAISGSSLFDGAEIYAGRILSVTFVNSIPFLPRRATDQEEYDSDDDYEDDDSTIDTSPRRQLVQDNEDVQCCSIV